MFEWMGNLRRLERLLWGLTLMFLAIPAVMWVEAFAYQYYLNRTFEQLAGTPSVTTALPRGSSEEGNSQKKKRPDSPRHSGLPAGLIGRLEIDDLSLSVMIQEGADEATLRRGVGHLTDSALPGQRGNVVLAAHRDTFFRSLERIKEDEIISLETADRRFLYQVSWTAVVEPEDVDVLDPTSENSLTLVTCYPFTYIGPAPQRFIVRAHQLPAE